jgi:hypothetical protein
MTDGAFFACGGGCPKGGDHSWDGPGIIFTRPCPDCADVVTSNCHRCGNTGEIPSGGSATCSKCGLDAMSDSMMNGP